MKLRQHGQKRALGRIQFHIQCLIVLAPLTLVGSVNAHAVEEKAANIQEILSQASQAVDAIRYSDNGAYLLSQIAMIYAKLGDQQSVKTTMLHAVEMANRSPNRFMNLLQVAKSYADLGDHESATTILQQAIGMVDSYDHEPDHQSILEKYGWRFTARIGRLGEIARTFQRIGDLNTADNVYRDMDRQCRFAWVWDRILHTTQKTHTCDDLEENHINVLLSQKNYNEALQIASTIRDALLKNYAYIAIVLSQWRNGDYEAAHRTADRFLDEVHRTYVFSDISLNDIHEEILRGNIEHALQRTDAIESMIVAGRAFIEIAEAQIKKGDVTEAKKTLQRAVEAANQSNAHYRNIEHLPKIAELYASMGDMNHALQVANAIGRDRSKNQPYPPDHFYANNRNVTLRVLVVGLAKGGDTNGALQLMKEQIHGNDDLQLALSEIIIALAERDNLKSAKKLFSANKFKLGSNDIECQLNLQRIFVAFALAQARTGHWSASRTTFEQALDVVRGDYSDDDLEKLASLHGTAGKISEIINWPILNKSPNLKVYALLGLADGILEGDATHVKSKSSIQ